MKTFIDICKMTESEVKTYMHKYLASKNYKVINKKGFIYAKGEVPVLLVAHMDTVHTEPVKNVVKMKGQYSSPQGIGGDDRCGIFMIMNIVNELNCSVLLCEKEEIGGVGARDFVKSDEAKEVNVNYIIEFDRKGNSDAVFYDCDNKDFTNFVCDNTGFKEAQGSFSDISTVAPALKTAAVNLSCGYYNAHTKAEYVVYDEMMDIVETAKALIKTECEHFDYVERERKYSYLGKGYYSNYDYYRGSSYNFNDDYLYGYQYNLFADNKLKTQVRKDLQTEIEVVYIDLEGNENIGYGTGSTKAEAWLDFFMTNEDVCFAQVQDYSFC